jgi:hypothetical protein
MESCIVSPGVEADGVGGKGRTSCAFAGGARIPLTARQLQEARERQIRLRGVQFRFFVPPPPNVRYLRATFTFAPPVVPESKCVARYLRNVRTIPPNRATPSKIKAGYFHSHRQDDIGKTNRVSPPVESMRTLGSFRHGVSRESANTDSDRYRVWRHDSTRSGPNRLSDTPRSPESSSTHLPSRNRSLAKT